MAGYSEVLNGVTGTPEAGGEPLSARDTLLALVTGNRAAHAAISAGWELGEEFVQPRAEALAGAEDAIFIHHEDVERQVGGDVRKSAAQVSRRGRLDPHLVHGAALLAMALAGDQR